MICKWVINCPQCFWVKTRDTYFSGISLQILIMLALHPMSLWAANHWSSSYMDKLCKEKMLLLYLLIFLGDPLVRHILTFSIKKGPNLSLFLCCHSRAVLSF